MERHRRAVADRLLEAVAAHVAGLVLLGAEGVEGVAVGAVDRRAGQPEQERVRQRLAHLAAEVAFLRAVGLVDQRDDVAAVVEDAAGLAELEDRGDDDLPHVLREQPLQLAAAVGLDEVRRVGGVEGARDLAVEVDPVDDDHHGRVLERRVQAQLPGREEHQQRLARALEVPDQALLRVAGDDALDDLVRALVLLVAGDDLDPALLLVGRVGGEVGQEVEHDVRPQHRGDRLLELLERRRRRRRRRPATAPTARPAARSSRSGAPCPRWRSRRRSARRAPGTLRS